MSTRITRSKKEGDDEEECRACHASATTKSCFRKEDGVPFDSCGKLLGGKLTVQASMLKEASFFAVLSIFLAPRVWIYLEKLPSSETPAPHFLLKNLWTQNELNSLRQMVKNLTFPTAAEDVTFERLEVSLPKLPDGGCPHRFLLPTKKDRCVLPQRIDVLSHYAKIGGRYGAKESMSQLINNVNNFQAYLHGAMLDRPEMAALFDSADYRKAAAAICGLDHPVQERVQVNVFVMMPGQDLPMHFDLPWFTYGANRHNTPQWLLVAMANSGLWDDDLIPHVQGVAYIHLNDTISGGDFFYYPNGPGREAQVLKANANSAVMLDGIRVIHGVQRFMPGHVAPGVKEPASLAYSPESDTFELRNQRDELISTKRFQDLRIGLVWRTICFKTDEERSSWNVSRQTYDSELGMQAMEADLRKRGRLGPTEPRPPLLDFALMLLDEYVKYPHDNLAWFPFNYCMLPYATTNVWLRGWLQAGVDMVC